jgi:Tol biopolymer transport system component
MALGAGERWLSFGGTPRGLAENIAFADWSPTGELAVVRNTGAKRQLDYPLGTLLFETPGYVMNPRVSPNGEHVAFLHETPAGVTELLVVDRRGQTRALSIAPATGASRPRNFSSQDGSGLAWVPSGEEVWFTTDNGNAIWASALSGGRKLIYQGVYEMRLEDISSSGSVLVNARASRRELAFLPPGQQRERGLSWLAWTHLAALSDDGQQVLFSSSEGEGTFTYMRSTDGALPVRLGPGEPFALSPDGEWVLSLSNEAPDVLSLLPVGPGFAKTISVNGIQVRRARWLQDGKRIVFLGLAPKGSSLQLYVVPVTGGVPRLISETPLRPFYFEVSRDDRLVAARPLNDIVTLFPVDGGTAIQLTELPKEKELVPFGWDAQGALWLRSFRELPCRVLRYDVSNRHVLEERVLAPADPTGLVVISQAFITPDGKAMAFDYVRTLGSLYLLDGLAPPRH